MAHAVEAFVIGPPHRRKVMSAVATVRTCELTSGLLLIPFTDELHDELLKRFPADADRPHPAFWKFSKSAEQFARALSADGAVAYLETEYFGGVGEQAAAVWRNGELVLSPSQADHPVNAALRSLGVARGVRDDEFDVVGLGLHRHTADWAERAIPVAG